MYLLVLACPEVNKSSVLTKVYNLGVSVVMNTGIDIHQMPLLAQFMSQLPDVDTHATGVFGT
tara:strand:+ start:83 stop:268 length:186 start_codon:yes stop_codon:yes gene_type:complete